MCDNSKFPISSRIDSLKTIIESRKTYRIPDYQRPYEWNETNIDDFLDSIFSGFKTSKPVFFGTIQLDIRDSREDIVDGQQRLTTFLLFLSVLDEILHNLNSISYKCIIEKAFHGEKTEELGLSDVITKPVSISQRDDIPENQKTQYYRNKILLYDKVSKNDEESVDFEKLYNYTLDNVYFVVLTTQEMPLSDVISVFNTINTTGLDLNASDIFKVKYYDFLSKHHPCKKGEDWMHKINLCYEKVDEKPKSYQARLYMSWILDVYKHIICAQFGFTYSDLSKSNVTFFNDLFGEEKYRDKLGDSILEFETFSQIVDLFIEFYRWIEDRIEAGDYSNYSCSPKELFSYHMLCKTRYSRYWTIPFVSAFFDVYRRNIDREQAYINGLKITLSCFKYFLVYSVIYAKVINDVQNRTCGLLHLIASDDHVNVCNRIEDIMWIQNSSSKAQKDGRKQEDRWEENRFWDSIMNNLYDNGSRAHLVCVLSALISELDAGTPSSEIKEKLFNWGKQQYDIEHIWARDLYDKDKSVSADDKPMLNGIGNLVVLNRTINRSIKNDTTSQKKGKYQRVLEKEYTYAIIEELCDNKKYDLDSWQTNMKQVEARMVNEIEKISEFMNDRIHIMGYTDGGEFS